MRFFASLGLERMLEGPCSFFYYLRTIPRKLGNFCRPEWDIFSFWFNDYNNINKSACDVTWCTAIWKLRLILSCLRCVLMNGPDHKDFCKKSRRWNFINICRTLLVTELISQLLYNDYTSWLSNSTQFLDSYPINLKRKYLTVKSLGNSAPSQQVGSGSSAHWNANCFVLVELAFGLKIEVLFMHELFWGVGIWIKLGITATSLDSMWW